ncbi:MAG: hypothetical protein IIX68_06360, partial [Clostridia bacterium]|nr:hypothetical protein [Clostridia bacterium]
LNLMITFLVSGLWHGASFSFVVWGGLHGLYQVIGELTEPVRKKCVEVCRLRTDWFVCKLFRGLITFALVDFAWIFFRCSSLTESMQYIRCIVAGIGTIPLGTASFALPGFYQESRLFCVCFSGERRKLSLQHCNSPFTRQKRMVFS